jgi:hypothetical protein
MYPLQSTQDADGMVELWDLTTGTVTQKFGAINFKEKEKSLFQVTLNSALAKQLLFQTRATALRS